MNNAPPPGKIYYNLKNFIPHKGNYGAGVSYGRFQVYHAGHALATNMIRKNLGLRAYIIASHTHKPPTDPMPPNRKLEFIRTAWPTNVVVNATSRNLSYIGSYIKNKIVPQMNGKKIVVFLGENRVRPSNNKNTKKFYLSNGLVKMGFNVVRSGKRVKGAAGVQGLSSSSLRNLAVKGNYKGFTAGLPASLRNTQTARTYFNNLHTILTTPQPAKKRVRPTSSRA